MKNDWELFILDENKDEWRKLKHTQLRVNKRWGLDASKVNCRLKNIAGYNYDWIRNCKEAKLYKNGKFYLYLHLTKIIPFRGKESYITLQFEDYWYYRLKKQLTPDELYGRLEGIRNDFLIKESLGTMTIIQEKFKGNESSIKARLDYHTIVTSNTLSFKTIVGEDHIHLNNASAFKIGEFLVINPEGEGEEEHLITNITGGDTVYITPTVKNPHSLGVTVGVRATNNMNIVMKEDSDDGYIEIGKPQITKYSQNGRVQSKVWRSDEPSWQGCGDITEIQLIKNDDDKGGTLNYYFSRDGGTTWYNITTWTDGFHILTGSEAIKNKPLWKAEFQRVTKTGSTKIQEVFDNENNWTKIGTKIGVTSQKVFIDDISTISKNSMRWTDDLSDDLDFKDEFSIEFETFVERPTDLANEEYSPRFYFMLSNDDRQYGDGIASYPVHKTWICFYPHRVDYPKAGGNIKYYLKTQFGHSYKKDAATEHVERISYERFTELTNVFPEIVSSTTYYGMKIYARITAMDGEMKLYLYKNSSRTILYDGFPIDLKHWLTAPDGSGDTLPNFKWLYLCNYYKGTDHYDGRKYMGTFDNLHIHAWCPTGEDRFLSPTIESLTILCKTVSESGLQEGDIDAYTAPAGMTNLTNLTFNRETRLNMLKTIVAVSPVDPTLDNPSPTWDCWIETKEDKSAELNFKAFYDVDANYLITRKGEREGDNYIKEINKEVDLDSLINSLYIVGGGWSNQGIAVPMHITNATDEVKAKTAIEYAAKIINRRAFTKPYLEAVSAVLLEMMKTPKNTYNVIPYPEWRDKFNVGEFVTVDDLETLTSEKLRIYEENWSISRSGENLNLSLESGSRRIEKYLQQVISNQRATQTTTQGAVTSPPVAYNDNFDAAHPVELWFYIPKKKNITKVSLFLKNQRFRTYSKVSEGESAHTHEQPKHTHSIQGKIIDGTIITSGLSSTVRAEQGTSHIISVRSGSQQLTSVDVWSTVSTWTAGQAYDVEDLLHSITYTTDGLSTANAYDISWRIRHVRGGDSWYYPSSVGNMTKIANYKRGAETEMLQPRAIQNGDQLILQRFATGTALLNKYIYWSWQIAAYDSRHSHVIGGKGVDGTTIAIGETTADGGDDTTEVGSEHTHEIDFGVMEYEYFAPAIKMYVDDRQDHSAIFGERGTEDGGFETIGLDITPDFDRDNDGIVDIGWHKIVFAPTISEGVNNLKGLGRMMVYLGFEEVSV